MEGSGSCKNCRKRTLIPDVDSGKLVCTSCSVVQDFEDFQHHIGGITGPVGTNVRVGTAGTGSVYQYKETKIYEAQKVIEDFMFKLSFSELKAHEVKLMIEKITQGEYGQGRWFDVFVGACSYVVMRKDMNPLSIVSVANVVGCDIYELGRMVYKVVDFLDLKLPEFGIVESFEHSLSNFSSFHGVSADLKGRMLKQGVFLIQCMVMWYVTTGRRPLPVVAAVLVFVAQLNLVDVKIEDVANELQVAVVTCKLRYKELLERLVKVARALPWGEDVTLENILKNAPFVIQYMELKATLKGSDNRKDFKDYGFDMDNLIDDCLCKENDYSYGVYDEVNESQYFQLEHSPNLSIESPNRFQVSQQCLDMLYSKIKNEVSTLKSSHNKDSNRRKRRREYDILSCTDWWKGESELSKKLLLKQILEKDVGFSATPPSFDRGCLAYERRQQKIKAAKLRIHRTMHPPRDGSNDNTELLIFEDASNGKKRRGKMEVHIDWEDFIIETLLLHQVKEEEIEKGYYRRLLDLHVFNY